MENKTTENKTVETNKEYDNELKKYCMNLINDISNKNIYKAQPKQSREELLDEIKKLANID